jgi:hypothetical protein
VESAAVQALPESQKAAVGGLVDAAHQLGEANIEEPQKVAAASVNVLVYYYTVVLQQSKRSFDWALIAAGVGLLFFLAAVGFIVVSGDTEVAAVSIIAGAVVEVIAGLNFYLYGKATEQLADYRRSLEQTQRFLLANSICGSLDDAVTKAEKRGDLVSTIAEWGRSSSESKESKTSSNHQESRRRRSKQTSLQDQETKESR